MASLPWKRLGASLLLILSFIFAPFWLTIVLLVCFLYIFEYFAEGVALFFLADLAYAVPLDRFFGFSYALTAIAMLLFIVSLVIKPYLLR